MYLQVLQQSIQKYGRAIELETAPSHNNIDQVSVSRDPDSPLDFFWATGGIRQCD